MIGKSGKLFLINFDLNFYNKIIFLYHFSGRGRPDYRDYRPPRDRYSPVRDAPPIKRMRGDWDDGRPRYGGR